MDRLLTSGRAASRRRRRRGLAAAAAATVAVVVAAGFVGSEVLTSGDRGDDLVAATPGTRLVGIGQAAVEVPAAWADGAATCNSPFKDTAFFPWPQDCVGRSSYVSSVAITSGGFTETGTRLSDLEPAGHVEGHRVVADTAACAVGQTESCAQVFGIPDLDAYFTVIVREDVDGGAKNQVDAIRSSLTVLPDDQTTLPFVPPLGSVSQTRAALEAAGLAVVVEQQTCPPNASCVGGVVSTTPAAGSVVATGSTVTIHVM
jgi:hypothetical protein